MFKETFILFLLFFIFSTYIKNAKSFNPQEIIKIKKKVFDVSPSINKTRSKKLIIKREFQEARLVFDAIKKQKWSKAKKIANQDTALIKLVDWYFLNQNKNPKFFQKTNDFFKNQSVSVRFSRQRINPIFKQLYLRAQMELENCIYHF